MATSSFPIVRGSRVSNGERTCTVETALAKSVDYRHPKRRANSMLKSTHGRYLSDKTHPGIHLNDGKAEEGEEEGLDGPKLARPTANPESSFW